MKHIRKKETPRQTVENENQNAETERLRSLIDYLGMMTDVELPEESEGIDDEQEV